MTVPKAQYKLKQLVEDIRNKDPKELRKKFKYIPKEDKPIDWSSYTEAQYNEMNDYLNLVREIIDEIRLEIGDMDQGNMGRPPKSCFDKAKAILVQQYFESSNRVTAGLLKVLKEKLNMSKYLTYKDIERAYENPYVLLVLRIYFEKTNDPVKGRETKFAGDGTGMPTSIKQNYANDREENDENKVKLYDMMMGIIGVKYKLLSAVEIANGHAGENPFIIPMLKDTQKLHEKIDMFAYDSAAYSLDTIRYISDIGAVPRIFPPADASLKAYGCVPKRKMLFDFVNYTQQWLREYHIRSLTESRNSVDKRVFPRPLLKRIECRRHFEAYVRACRYNTRQLVYIYYLNNLDVRWLKAEGY